MTVEECKELNDAADRLHAHDYNSSESPYIRPFMPFDDNAIIEDRRLVIGSCIDALTPFSIDEWSEDEGNVLWWKLPVEEPPYCGTPLDSDWPGYHTHWTPILIPREPK